jgi:threo-3-hydroxy-L-aspartate ammonia-lyase
MNEFAARLPSVERRLRGHAAAGLPGGLTEPDQGGEERWDAGQVWAHLAEFVPFWQAEVAKVLYGRGEGPVPFGRTKADPERIAAIERDRGQPTEALLSRITDQIAELGQTLDRLPDDGWAARGLHSRLGEMSMPQIVERFLVGHLEEHADQLDRLAGLVSLNDIREAARRIRGVAVRTPLLAWDDRTWLKPESLQPVGAFKMRGAYNKLASLTDAERTAGVITYSSGNHGQAVARAARLLGAPAVIVMPADAPPIKVDGVRRDGAEVVWCQTPSSEEREKIARDLAAERGYTVVPPYDDPAVIAGQGTAGLEIVEDLPNVTSVLIPTSGGGLLAGIAAAVARLAPRARILGVEPELAADAAESLHRGELVSWPSEKTARTMADGLRTQSLGRLPFEHLRRFVDDIVTVSEEEMLEAIRQLAGRGRLVVEPSGAAAMAAHISGRASQPDGDNARVVVISGGNVDPRRFAEILTADNGG